MRTAKAENKIKRWERKYPLSTVRLFVEDALSAGRSERNREVYQGWINNHPVAPIEEILEFFPNWPTSMRPTIQEVPVPNEYLNLIDLGRYTDPPTDEEGEDEDRLQES